ncbi:uncharacterized protein BX664DRAFT_363580 [Halteromyces radiatus]|uniref:uncharacterized protein n=1 Tax=Halteromyces radiatus TaxID=101107 RepID=UPI002220525D|nr:uncharacterized protein BX664DRAFT_363580 [Halteromyces radiatus]KAI8099829.1 hypothetical protein BX664DRAFT_363580 [Halteromyces radiatus]
MEAKVHEATNNEAWGASSTLMLEIAQGTFNYQYFNEIMPTLYKRFTEKEASQWRQIYKALVLLEYLVKNGSERVVDDARSHISMIKIMRNFHHIDEKGKDQGINIRNRAKELADLLSDIDRIKAERKKARQNRNKYTGVGSESTSFGMGSGGGGFSSSSGSRFTGFGSDSLPTMGSGGGFSSSGIGSNGFYDDDDIGGKYDDDDDVDVSRSSKKTTTVSNPSSPIQRSQPATAKEANLFDFGDSEPSNEQKVDDDWGDFATGGTSNGNDDFDDFQSAPAVSNTAKTTVQTSATTAKKNDLFDLLGDDTFTSSSAAPTFVSPSMVASQPSLLDQQTNTFTTSSSSSRPMTPSSNMTTSSNVSTNNNNNNNKKSDLPGGIWSQASGFVSLDSLGKNNQTNKTSTGPSMNAMKSTSVNAGWNNWASANSSPLMTPQQQQQQQQKSSSPFDDLLS